MGYPKSMYRGHFSDSAINADHKIARSESEERALRKKEFVDGHEFFSNIANKVQDEESE